MRLKLSLSTCDIGSDFKFTDQGQYWAILEVAVDLGSKLRVKVTWWVILRCLGGFQGHYPCSRFIVSHNIAVMLLLHSPGKRWVMVVVIGDLKVFVKVDHTRVNWSALRSLSHTKLLLSYFYRVKVTGG